MIEKLWAPESLKRIKRLFISFILLWIFLTIIAIFIINTIDDPYFSGWNSEVGLWTIPRDFKRLPLTTQFLIAIPFLIIHVMPQIDYMKYSYNQAHRYLPRNSTYADLFSLILEEQLWVQLLANPIFWVMVVGMFITFLFVGNWKDVAIVAIAFFMFTWLIQWVMLLDTLENAVWINPHFKGYLYPQIRTFLTGYLFYGMFFLLIWSALPAIIIKVMDEYHLLGLIKHYAEEAPQKARQSGKSMIQQQGRKKENSQPVVHKTVQPRSQPIIQTQQPQKKKKFGFFR